MKMYNLWAKNKNFLNTIKAKLANLQYDSLY